MNKAEENYRVIMQIEDSRDFMLAMYSQNPSLLKTAEKRIRELFQFAQTDENTQATKQRGVSLVELIMFIVIIGAAMVGILSVMNVTTAHSADPLIHKQAIAIAESLLEEVELQDFIAASGAVRAGTVTTGVTGNRATGYHIVNDYNFSMTGIALFDGSTPSALANYNAKVQVTNAALGNITAASASAVQITVTVTDPSSNTIQIDGYRTAY